MKKQAHAEEQHDSDQALNSLGPVFSDRTGFLRTLRFRFAHEIGGGGRILGFTGLVNSFPMLPQGSGGYYGTEGDVREIWREAARNGGFVDFARLPTTGA